MPSSINASTSGAGGVITSADNSGILNLQSGGVTVATINSTGIVMASNTAPAFSAYANASTLTTSGANTKISFQLKEYDTNNNFASSRFTPTVAGYYQFNSVFNWGSAQTTRNVIYVFKNGSSSTTAYGTDFGNSNNYVSLLSSLQYANGSTDYFEIYVYQQSGGNLTVGNNSWFQGFLARSA